MQGYKKHGRSNFKLDILEYCEPKDLLESLFGERSDAADKHII